MVRNCCIRGCNSESYAGCGISFHRFPRDEFYKRIWIEVISREITKSSMVCSRHFGKEDFIISCSRLTLKSDAVPSIFPVPASKRNVMLSNTQLMSNIKLNIEKTGSLNESMNQFEEDNIKPKPETSQQSLDPAEPGHEKARHEDNFQHTPCEDYIGPEPGISPKSLDLVVFSHKEPQFVDCSQSEMDYIKLEPGISQNIKPEPGTPQESPNLVVFTHKNPQFIDNVQSEMDNPEPRISQKSLERIDHPPKQAQYKDVSVQTPHFRTEEEKLLQNEIKILRQRLNRRNLKINKMKSLLDSTKVKHKKFEEVKNTAKNNEQKLIRIYEIA